MKTKNVKTKHTPPEQRMKRYKTARDKGDTYDFTNFIIVAKTTADKKEIEAAMEYLHDRDIDTDFITVNQLVHQYPHGDESDKHSRVMVDFDLYQHLSQAICPHPKESNYIGDGIRYCKLCWKALEITSFRD